MRRLRLRAIVFIFHAAATAHAAQGVNLRWSSCLGDGGTYNRNFACDTNTGANVLVGSFELGSPLAQVNGNEMIIDLTFGSLGLPAWWAFTKAGFCRQTSLALDTALPPAALNCVDWASGQSAGGIGDYRINLNGFGTAKIVMAIALPGAGLVDLEGGQEYFSFSLTIDNAKTVGGGSCGGCDIPVCLFLVRVTLTTPVEANDLVIYTATNGTAPASVFATWQGGATSPQHNFNACPLATPTRRESWGAVKALYH